MQMIINNKEMMMKKVRVISLVAAGFMVSALVLSKIGK